MAALAAHGAATALQERVREFSDYFTVYICGTCHDMANACETIDFFFCESCKTRETVRKCAVLFCFALIVVLSLFFSDSVYSACPHQGTRCNWHHFKTNRWRRRPMRLWHRGNSIRRHRRCGLRWLSKTKTWASRMWITLKLMAKKRKRVGV